MQGSALRACAWPRRERRRILETGIAAFSQWNVVRALEEPVCPGRPIRLGRKVRWDRGASAAAQFLPGRLRAGLNRL